MPVAFAVLAVSLVGVIVLERRVGPGEVSPAMARLPGTTAKEQAGTASPATDPAPGAVATMLARPLFEPDRRPLAISAVATGAEVLPRLTGVLVTPDGRRVIFAGAAGGKPVIATEGSRIGAFLVQSIGVGEVTVLGPAGVRTVRPTFDAAHADAARAGNGNPAPAGGSPNATPPALTRPAGAIAPNPGSNPDTITLPLQAPS